MDTIISGNKNIIKFIYSSENYAGFSNDVKLSTFNYIQKGKKSYLVCNTLCNTLVRLTSLEYEKLMGKKKAGRELRKTFIKHGLLIAKELDELKIYNQWSALQRRIDRPYISVNIATTLKCNARCYYCYEKGVRHSDFRERQFPLLIKFLKEKVRENDTLALNWFGGEPLMNKKVLNFVSSELKKSEILFYSYIITNGSLINKRMVNTDFVRWNVKDVQITLDGLRETYEKRKAYTEKKRNIFSRILQKIELVAASGIRVHIRLNVDKRNRMEILALTELLCNRYGQFKEVTWYPAFLTGIDDDLTEEEKISFIKDMFAITQNPAKMNIGRRLYSVPKSRACMRNDPKSFSIDVFGNVYSCEHLVGRKEMSIGTLSAFDNEKNLCRSDVALRNECNQCVFLPKCMGGCAANLETNDEPCMIEKYMIQGYLAYLAE